MSFGQAPLQTAGVNDVYEYNEIHLDSVARDAGTNDEPVFVINPPFDNVLGIKLVSAQIPFTYYVFDDTNGSFQILPGADPAQARTVTLPPGNYTVTSISAPLTAALGAATGDTYSFIYSGATGRFTLRSTTGQVFALAFGSDAGDDGVTNPRLWLGFAGGINPSDASGNLVAPYTANITGPNYLYVTTSFGGRISRNIRVNGGSTPEAPAIAKIPVTVNPYGLITYTDPSGSYAFDMSNGQVQNLKVGLMFGHTLQKVRMNGSPWSLVLHVLTQRDTTVSRRVTDKGEGANTGQKRIRVK
jgi:hypothetical protein